METTDFRVEPGNGVTACADGAELAGGSLNWMEKQIPIPDIFSCMNSRKRFSDWNSGWYYGKLTENGGKASSCIKCGKCEKSCPQHLEIRGLLEQCAAEFEKKTD